MFFRSVFTWLTVSSAILAAATPAMAQIQTGASAGPALTPALTNLIREEEAALHKDSLYLREIKAALANAQWDQTIGAYTFGGAAGGTMLSYLTMIALIKSPRASLVRLFGLLTMGLGVTSLGGSLVAHVAQKDLVRLQAQIDRETEVIGARAQRLKQIKAELGLGDSGPNINGLQPPTPNR